LSEKEKFVETQVEFQFGRCQATRGFDVAQAAAELAKGRPNLLFHAPEQSTFVPPERALPLTFESGQWRFVQPPGPEILGGAKLSVERQADTLNELAEAGVTAPFIVDMHDAIRKSGPFPVFQYNRLIGAENSILWPLDRVHRIGAKSFCSPLSLDEKPLRQKKPGLCWRGAVRGFTTVSGKPVNIRSAVQRFQKNQIDREALRANLNALPRYQFVSRYFDHEDFDIGFSNRTQERKGWSDVPEIARYQKPYASPEEQAEYKYVFSIQGTDVGSSFGWQISTNCVILRETYQWEVFFDCHFQPWEHYVPIRPDFSDIPEKIAWCEAHPAECQGMIDRRHALVPLLLDPAARWECLRRVAKRYQDFYAAGDFRPLRKRS
jgi:hypothetical protein